MEVRKVEDIHLEFIEQQLRATNLPLDEAIEDCRKWHRERREQWASKALERPYKCTSPNVVDEQRSRYGAAIKQTRRFSKQRQALLDDIAKEKHEQRDNKPAISTVRQKKMARVRMRERAKARRQREEKLQGPLEVSQDWRCPVDLTRSSDGLP